MNKSVQNLNNLNRALGLAIGALEVILISSEFNKEGLKKVLNEIKFISGELPTIYTKGEEQNEQK